MIVLGLIIVFYLISVVLLSIFMFFFLLHFFSKYSIIFDDIGIDRILFLNPFFFPVNKTIKIVEEKDIENKKKLLKKLSLIRFYKFYTIIGVIICIPCIAFLANSNLGLNVPK